MSNPDITSQRIFMAKVLFWVFVSVFVVTAVLAVTGLLLILFGPDPDHREQLIFFARALWAGVLAEVAGGIFALWKDLFGLSAERDLVTAYNAVGEIIDGLEASGKLSDDAITALQIEYAKQLRINMRPVRPH